MKFFFLILNYNVVTTHYQLCFDVRLWQWKIWAGACKIKRGGRDKALGGRGETTGRVQSKKRGEGSWEKETREGSEKASRGEETAKEESREIDKDRARTTKAKRGGRYLLLGSGSIGGSHIGTEKKLVEEAESGTSGSSTVKWEDESDWPSSFNKKATSPLFSQGDFGTIPGEKRNG